MKNIFLLTFLIVLVMINYSYGTDSDYKIRVFCTKSGKNIGLDNMVKAISKNRDVLFVGEIHDDKISHMIEYLIYKKLNEKNKIWDLSMEMFERDIQDVINGYFSSLISENLFLKNSRPWPNYNSDYRPIVEYAKKNGLKLIAANIPRRYAAMIAKKGWDSIKTLPEGERCYIAKSLYAPKDRYYRKFKKTMSSMKKHIKNQKLFNKMVYNIYRAQCIKDNSMAESIFNYLKNNKGRKIVHYNGQFHSDSFLGTVERLKRYNHNLKISVISLIPLEGKIPTYLRKKDRGIANYVIYCKRIGKTAKIKSKMFKK